MKKGMTLVEILIAIGIFGLIMLLIFGTFLSGVKRQRSLIELQNVLDNTRYLTEIIAREIRMAKRDRNGICLARPKQTFCLTNPLTHQCISRPSTEEFGFGSGIKFLNYKGECVEFFQEGGFIKKKIGEEIFIFSSKNVKVLELNFGLKGEIAEDNFQPRVLLSMEMEGDKVKEGTKIRLQTVISSREIDTP